MEVVGSQAFDDLIRKMRSGRITRRTFLEQTLVLGLTSSQDQDVLAKNPFFKHLGPVLQTALPRPTSPRYIDLSSAIQSRVHRALTKQSSPAQALTGLEGDLKLIVNS